MIEVKIKLANGIYTLYNGKDCDGYPYTALLVVTRADIFFSGFTLSPYDNLKKVELENGECLFTKLGVTDYEKYRSWD
jgi:hypothetical protein